MTPGPDHEQPDQKNPPAPDGQDAPGASDANGAGVAVVAVPKEQAGGIDPAFARYVGVLRRDKRDMEGLLLPTGTQVLVNWLDPETFLENSEPNRRAFERGDFAWTADVRKKAWLPPVPAQLATTLDPVRSAKSKFHAAVSRNLHDAVKTPFPEFGRPFWFCLLPWTPKISGIEQVGDLTEFASEITRSKCGVPVDVDWSREWTDALGGISEIRIYELKTSGAAIHVVAGFITQMSFERGRTPQAAAVTQEVASAVLTEYRRWLTRSDGAKPAYTYLTLGSVCDWPRGVVGVQAGDHLTVYCSRDGDGGDWTVRMPEHATAPKGVCSFLDRLRPETRDDFARKLSQIVDEELYNGNPVHVKWLYETLNREYSRLSIKQTMLDLQDTGDYQLYWTRSKQLAIANLTITPQADVPGPRITSGSLKM